MKYGNYTINEDENTSVSKIINTIRKESNVIEFGSSYGYILEYLKNKKQCNVQGYEIDQKAVDLANDHGIPTSWIDLDTVTYDFFEKLDTNIDYIICADVLEHLKNMDNILKWISLYLEKNPNCKLLISFPNITYYGVLEQLLHGNFKYRDLGILDNTHLKFYDKYELEKKFNQYHLDIISISSIEVEPQYSEFEVNLDEKIVDLLETQGHQDYLTYQYVFELEYSLKPNEKLIASKSKNSVIDSLNSKKNNQIIDLISTISKKDSQIVDLNNSVNTKDSQIVDLNNSVNTKDSQIITLNKLAHQQAENLQTLAQNISSLQMTMNEQNRQQEDLAIKNNTLLLLNKQMKNDIDISIVTYNSKKWMDSFFESLLEQSYPLSKLHIFITDNSSTDDTYHYLISLKEKYSTTFASFTLKKAKNLGFGHGHNNNFKNAKSKFVLVTNVDLEFEKYSIENIVEYALLDDSTTASWEFRQKPYEHPKYYNPVTLETTWSSSACVLFRKDAIDKVGGYDDHIFMYGEDVELSYRLRDYGYTLKYYPKAVCWHYTYAVANEIKELQYFGSTLAHILIRMRYGSKIQLKEGLISYKNLLNAQGLFINQRRKQLKYLFKLIMKAPYFLFNRKKNRDITYKFINWDYEFIRDGAFYTYSENKQTETPLVSVIMRTCCERNDFLKEAIESVKNQTYTNIELVVIEDGTTNAAKLMQTIKSNSISNVIYRSIEKAGRCHAGNVGLEISNGKYMVFLDDDDLFFADHVEVLVNAFTENPDMGACYTSSFEVKTDIISKNPLKYVEKEFAIIHKEEFNREIMLHHNFIPIQSILFKRSLYEEYGGFDEALDNLEDWNLWTRYSYLNDFKFIDKTTSLYRVPSCPDSSSARQNELDRYYQLAVEKQKTFIEMIKNKQESN